MRTFVLIALVSAALQWTASAQAQTSEDYINAFGGKAGPSGQEKPSSPNGANQQVEDYVKLFGGAATPSDTGGKTFEEMQQRKKTRELRFGAGSRQFCLKDDPACKGEAEKVQKEQEVERKEVVKATENKPKIDFEIYFEYNSAELTRESKQKLDPLGRAIVDPRLREMKFYIIGHTDKKGERLYNLDLSERRAESVRQYFMQNYAAAGQNLLAQGQGFENPKNPADPYAPENRRVQVIRAN